MITSKLTTTARTTIPQPVRAALRLKEGDELAYEIEENRVILTKASAGGVSELARARATLALIEPVARHSIPGYGHNVSVGPACK